MHVTENVRQFDIIRWRPLFGYVCKLLIRYCKMFASVIGLFKRMKKGSLVLGREKLRPHLHRDIVTF